MSNKTGDTSYPVSKQFNMHFSPYEDRLIVRAQRSDGSDVYMLLTRRMVMLILQQMLAKLPELTGLEKTPAVYWQEVLQMAHQEAMEAKASADKVLADKALTEEKDQKQAPGADEAQPATQDTNAEPESASPAAENLYLATELMVQTGEERLTLAFKGLPMPEAMVEPRPYLPIFAIPLEVDNVHQLIELLINKCQQAQWHLPLELPWIDAPNEGEGNKKYSLRQH